MSIEEMINGDMDAPTGVAERINAIELNVPNIKLRNEQILEVIEDHFVTTVGFPLTVNQINTVMRIIADEASFASCGENIKHQAFWHRTRRLWDREFYSSSLTAVMAVKAGLPKTILEDSEEIRDLVSIHYKMTVNMATQGRNYYRMMKEAREPFFLNYSREQLIGLAPSLKDMTQPKTFAEVVELIRTVGAIPQELGGKKPAHWNEVRGHEGHELMAAAIYRELRKTPVPIDLMPVDDVVTFIKLALKHRVVGWEDNTFGISSNLMLDQPQLMTAARKYGWLLPIRQIATEWFQLLIKNDLFLDRLPVIELYCYMEDTYNVSTN